MSLQFLPEVVFGHRCAYVDDEKITVRGMEILRKIDAAGAAKMAVGAAVLGTGGGGDPTIGMLMAQQMIAKHGPINMVSLDSVPDDKWIIPVAVIGAPTVLIEKIPSGAEVLEALRTLEEKLGVKAWGVVPIEAGGGNSMVPLIAAACRNIPFIDADAMGRAFPELQMATPEIFGISASPMSLCDEKGNRLVIDAPSSAWAEKIGRAVSVRMGGRAHMALYPMKGIDAKRVLIRNTMTLAYEIGESLAYEQADGALRLQRLLIKTSGVLLGRGKIVDVQRRTQRGFAVGEVVLEGMGEDAQSEMKIAFQNENLIFWKDNVAMATVPDLITVLDEQTSYPITTEGLRYGQRVVVIGIPCDEKWRSEKGIELVGPQYFGYSTEYRPLRAASYA